MNSTSLCRSRQPFLRQHHQRSRPARGPRSLRLAIFAGLVVAAAAEAGPSGPLPPPAVLNADELARTRAALAAIVQEPTVAGAPPETFKRVHAKLKQAFPRTFSTLDIEPIGTSLLLKWPGRSALAPFMLLAHLDVVPVDPGTEKNWKVPPFSGEVVQGALWGRGTLDDKSSAVGILAAIESLLEGGYTPERTLLVALGGDEETGGSAGAALVAATLKQRNIRPVFLLDEGYAVIDGAIVGVSRPVAMIGLAEKGYLTIRLRSQGPGGHSSMPPEHTAIGQLARAIARLEDSPLPSRLDDPMRSGLEALAPHMPGAQGLALRALWLTSPLVRHLLESKPATAAQIRTTMAVTMISGGVAENVLPEEAVATVNFRLLPGDSPQDVLDHVQRSVDDEGITIEVVTQGSSAPSRVSSTRGIGWESMSETLARVMPDAVVAPGLTIGGTDAKHFEGIAEQVYRFLPMRLNAEDLARIHGLDERIPLSNLDEFPVFYKTLIEIVNKNSHQDPP